MSATRDRQPVRPYGGIDAAERVANRREQLLQAGLELFGTRGYRATRVKDVCRAAKLTDRYFYESFQGTPGLFLAVFDSVIDELFAAVAQAVAEAEPTRTEQLRAGIGTFLTALDSDPRKLRIVFAEPAAAGSEAAGHMRASLHKFAALVADTARHTRSGDKRIDLFALSLVGTLERILVERQDAHLDLPIEQVIDYCTSLAHTTLSAIDSGDIARPTGQTPQNTSEAAAACGH